MWSAYIKPDLIKRFQKEHNCCVVVDTYDSNEAMYTKLKLGGAGYDVVFPSNYFLDLMSKQGMLLAVNSKDIPNSVYVDWDFLQKLDITQGRNGLPYMVSFSGIAWRKDRLEHEPSSWAIFGNKKLKGRMTMLNDMRETMGAGLLYLGYSVNSTSASEIAQARDVICHWKRQLVKLESEQYKNGIASAEYLVVHGFSGDCLQVANENPYVSFSYPKEGSVLSVDYAAILKSTHDVELSLAFLNFLHNPDVAAQNMEYVFYRCLNTKARQLLPTNLQASPLFYPELDPSIRFECIHSVQSAQKEYLQAWDVIKGSDS